VDVDDAEFGPVECFVADSTLAYAIAPPAMNRITPITTNMSVCFFTGLPPHDDGP
jgi:hypothetical protein